MRLFRSRARGTFRGGGTLAPGEVAFVLCIEANRLEPQGLLLCESIRTFGGRYREAPIVAVSPRPQLALGPAARERLRALGVRYAVEPLNGTGSPYGTVNRVVAGAWAEAALAEPYLAVLDTDTVLVGEPDLVRADAGARPVDLKGSASGGAGDPLDAYWERLCRLAGIGLERLPRLTASLDGATVRASYNGGFTVVRRGLGALGRTRDVFLAAMAEGLRPLAGLGLDVHASTGPVGREASEWWGSSQAALSVAIWSLTSDVHLYDARYNVPLNGLTGRGARWPTGVGWRPLLLHYHHLAEPGRRDELRRALACAGCPRTAARWLEERLSLFG